MSPVSRSDQLLPGESARIVTPIDDDESVVVAESAQTPTGPRTVLVPGL